MNGAYQDSKIYKYSISYLETLTDNGLHKHYELKIVDQSKLPQSNVTPQQLKDSIIKLSGHKKPTLKDYEKYAPLKDFDKTAIRKTGLEDAHGKLNKMYSYLAERLGNFK